MANRVIVRIIARPTVALDGMRLDKYTPGEAYDLSPTLAEYLIVQGFANFRDASRGATTI
jgi:hypothetical protein